MATYNYLDKTGLGLVWGKIKTYIGNNFLSKTNTTSYTPTANYHPATKKYVDDSIPTVPTKVSQLTNDSGFISSYTETDPIFTASAAHGITSTDITNWNNKTSNTGTVTKVIAGTGLSIGTTAGGNFTTSGTINHTNSVTAQNTQAVYPIKIDKNGHISAYGSAQTILSLGTSSSTAFRGDYGNSAYAHAVTNKGSAFSSGFYKITTNSEGHVTGATAVQKSDITGLGIPAQDTTYTFDGTYNASTNKAATVSTVNNALTNTTLIGTTTAESIYTDELTSGNLIVNGGASFVNTISVGSAPTSDMNVATKKYVDDSIDASSISPNWNENNTTSANYIANRTHWKEEETATIIPEQTVNVEYDSSEGVYYTSGSINEEYVVQLEKGTEIYVNCQGNNYNTEINYSDDYYSSCDTIDCTDYMIVLVLNSDSFSINFYYSGEQHNIPSTITISATAILSTYHKLNSKYLNGTLIQSGTGENSEIFNYYENKASGYASHAEGYGTTASGDASHAEGGNTTASGLRSHTEGDKTKASGAYSHAEGYGTKASGDYSHAEGSNTTASNNYSHAEGWHTTVSGYASHAEGYSTTASGDTSHAEGYGTTASGNTSHAEGNYTIAQRRSQHVFGEYNVLDTAGSTTTKGSYIEIVGNGTSSSARSNARTLDWNGNEILKGKLTVGAAPTNNMDVATKRYVDTATNGIPTKTSDLTNDSGFMTGMTILSYGSSSWADFIDVYTNKRVVYCRASSNSNPASGSQTRLAFMAYVNNAESPTEVEFQYYRSVNGHSNNQQGDQVYVYKLTKSSGWSVTVRENYTKVVAGTGLTGNWASGAITLSLNSNTVATTSANGLMSSTDKSRLDTLYADYSSALTALGGS